VNSPSFTRPLDAALSSAGLSPREWTNVSIEHGSRGIRVTLRRG
jgi:hypothetical protein